MDREKMIKLVGKEFKLSDESIINFIGGDLFLIFPNGRNLLLLDFKLIQQGNKKFVEIKRCLLVDEGLGE